MLLKVENVHVELGERDVLKNVSADFHPGALTGVIGPNGAGKTTLLRALAGILPIQAGKFRWTASPSKRSPEKKRPAAWAISPRDRSRRFPSAWTKLS